MKNVTIRLLKLGVETLKTSSKLAFIILSIIIVICIIFNQEIFFRYDTLIYENNSILVRTNRITGNSEFMFPNSLEWIDRDGLKAQELLKLKDDLEAVKVRKNEIELLLDNNDEVLLSKASAWEIEESKRRGITLREMFVLDLTDLENQIKKLSL